MQVDYLTIARRGRIDALEVLDRRQLELPGMSEPTLWKDDRYGVQEPEFQFSSARQRTV